MRVFKRGTSWYIDYRVNGKRIMKSFGRHKNLAELYVKELELREFRGELQFVDDSISIDTFLSKYIEYCKVSKSASTIRTDLSRLKIFKGFLNSKSIRRLKDITPFVFEQFKLRVLQDAGPVTFNRYLQLVKAMLNKGVEWGMLKDNPLGNFQLLKNTNQRQIKFFTREEIEKILRNSTGTLHAFIRIALYTGMRRSEIINLKWEDIDFENGFISVQSDSQTGFHPKGYRPRAIPVSKELKSLLLDLAQLGKYVFDNGKNQHLHCADYYTKEFSKLLKRLGIANANIHTLRHTFASYLVMNGVDIRTVQDLLGHSTVSVTEKYSHLSPIHRQKAAEALKFGNKMETI